MFIMKYFEFTFPWYALISDLGLALAPGVAPDLVGTRTLVLPSGPIFVPVIIGCC